MRKNIDELKKIYTKNLLRYYKAERQRFHNISYYCKCGCDEAMLEIYPKNYADLESKYIEHNAYLNLIKNELNTREHIS